MDCRANRYWGKRPTMGGKKPTGASSLPGFLRVKFGRSGTIGPPAESPYGVVLAWKDPIMSRIIMIALLLTLTPLPIRGQESADADGAEKFHLDFGGQLRVRPEFWSDFAFNETNDDIFGLLRFRLHGRLQLGPLFQIFVEGKSALADGRTLPGGLRILDVDVADVQNAFFQLKIPLDDESSLTFQAGRQELEFGKQRLVSPLDWSNTRPRMFDGFRGTFQRSSWRVDGFWTRFVRVRKYAFNRHDSGTDFFGIYSSGGIPRTRLVLDLYWLGRDRENLNSALPSAQERRHTVGGRLSGQLIPAQWEVDVEAAYQFGSRIGNDIDAFMLATELSRSFPGARMKPRVYAGFDYASGDRNPSDDKVQTFDHLFPLGHAYLGFIDAVGRQNIVAVRQGVAVNPADRLAFIFDIHQFWRAHTSDALYDAGGAVLRAAANGTSRRVGWEIDLTGRYRFDNRTWVTLGWSHFFAGDFIRQTGPAEDINFAYVMVEYTF